MKTSAYRIQWGYTDGGGSLWWFVGIVFGGAFALGFPALLEIWRQVLLVGTVLLYLSAPLIGLYMTRLFTRYMEARQKKTKLRGPSYADYAYII